VGTGRTYARLDFVDGRNGQLKYGGTIADSFLPYSSPAAP